MSSPHKNLPCTTNANIAPDSVRPPSSVKQDTDDDGGPKFEVKKKSSEKKPKNPRPTISNRQARIDNQPKASTKKTGGVSAEKPRNDWGAGNMYAMLDQMDL